MHRDVECRISLGSWNMCRYDAIRTSNIIGARSRGGDRKRRELKLRVRHEIHHVEHERTRCDPVFEFLSNVNGANFTRKHRSTHRFVVLREMRDTAPGSRFRRRGADVINFLLTHLTESNDGLLTHAYLIRYQ